MYRDGRGSGGRPKGRLNEKTIEVMEFCRSVCDNADYKTSILSRAIKGTLGSKEPIVWAYACGRPKEQVDLRVGRLDEEDLSGLSVDELVRRARDLVEKVEEAKALAKAIPAEYFNEEAIR